MVGRIDLTTDPATRDALLLARRGQAWFSRALRRLNDVEFTSPSGIPGWSHAHVIAAVGLHARSLAEAADAAAQGSEVLTHDLGTISAAVPMAATLPPQALRNLSDHAAVHLNVAWRDLDDHGFERALGCSGQPRSVASTIRDRANVVWWAACALDGRADRRAIPTAVGEIDEQAGWGELIRSGAAQPEV